MHFSFLRSTFLEIFQAYLKVETLVQWTVYSATITRILSILFVFPGFIWSKSQNTASFYLWVLQRLMHFKNTPSMVFPLTFKKRAKKSPFWKLRMLSLVFKLRRAGV
jgi:hypothetical protein